MSGRITVLGFGLLLAMASAGCAARRMDSPTPAQPTAIADDKGRFVLAADRRTTVFDGYVRVRFPSSVSIARSRSLLERHGLEVIGWDPHADAWLARTVSSLASVMALENRLWPTVVEVDPILTDIPGPIEDPVGRESAFHRVPRDCRTLGVVLDAVDPSIFDGKVSDNGGTQVTVGETLRLIQFPSTAAMEAAQSELHDLDGVQRIGPLISSSPVAILTNQLIVTLTGETHPRSLDLVSMRLEYVRPLPYLDNGHLLAWEGSQQGETFAPSCAIYDVAEALLTDSRVRTAIPNLATENRAACSGTSCTIDAHQDYLEEIGTCGAWQALETAAATSTVEPAVVAVLDYGAYDDSACADLNPATVVDFDTMQHCVPDPDDRSNWCTDCSGVVGGWTGNSHGTQAALTVAADCDDPDASGVAPGRLIVNARGLGDALMTDIELADALWWLAGGDPQWVCDPGATDYPVNYCESGGAVSSGDELPCPLGASTTADGSACVVSEFDSSSYKAAVLNLSFTREDFLATTDDCLDSSGTLVTSGSACRVVCDEGGATCGILEGVLQRLRRPHSGDGVREKGVTIVAAAGIDATRYETVSGVTVSRAQNSLCFDTAGDPANDVYRTHEEWNRHTDLATSTATIAAGSVTSPTSGSHPFTDDGTDQCLIQFRGDFLDVVAPMGGTGGYQTLCHDCADCDGTPCDHTFGESSAATAITSGVAALMLEANPSLTADQIHCILRSTANPLNGASEAWDKPEGWQVPDCDWATGEIKDHSDCLGYGMVDAEMAVLAASSACVGSTDTDCLWPVDVDAADLSACLQTFTVEEPDEPKDDDPPIIVELIPVCCLEMPDIIYERLKCQLSGRCNCKKIRRDILAKYPWLPKNTCNLIEYLPIELKPELPRRVFFDVEFKLCVGEECRLLRSLDRWDPSKDTVAIPVPADPKMISLMRLAERRGHPPGVIQIFSRGRKLTTRDLPAR